MSKRVAVVHDFCFQFGGAEKVVEKFLEMYPDADLVTSIFVESKFQSSDILTSHYDSNKIKTTWLNGLFRFKNGFLLRYFKHFFWLYPFVMRFVVLRDYDLVLISSTDCGKQIRFNNSPKIIHYCHTPTRYLHSLVDSDSYKLGFFHRFLLPVFVFCLRPLDLSAVQYLNSKNCVWVANSIFVQGLIKDIYKTDSVVIYPPIEVDKFLGLVRHTPRGGVTAEPSGWLNDSNEGMSDRMGNDNRVNLLLDNEGIPSQAEDDSLKNESCDRTKSSEANFTFQSEGILKRVQNDSYESELKDSFYLSHGRISFHKRIDLVIRACLELGLKLKVSGTSALPSELQDLQKIIDDYELEFPNKKGLVELLGRTTDEQIYALISSCEGFIFPGKEDFGIAPVEMLAAGVPIIAYRAGGALEYVKENINGVFFEEQNVQSLKIGIAKFEKIIDWDEFKIRESVKEFGVQVFVTKIKELIN